MTFGCYLFGQSTSSVLYTLYAGEGIFGTALKQVLVTGPVANGFNPILITADFSDISLSIGQRYTFKASLPSEGLPASGTVSTASASYTGSDNPYLNGRFYFTGSPYNQNQPAFSNRDLAFSMSGVTSAVPEPATWAMMIVGFGLVGGSMRVSRRKVTLATS